MCVFLEFLRGDSFFFLKFCVSLQLYGTRKGFLKKFLLDLLTTVYLYRVSFISAKIVATHRRLYLRRQAYKVAD